MGWYSMKEAHPQKSGLDFVNRGSYGIADYISHHLSTSSHDLIGQRHGSN